MCWVGERGSTGISGPASNTVFEIRDGRWKKEHAELQGLCFEIMDFINKHPDIVSKVEITRCTIKSFISDSE